MKTLTEVDLAYAAGLFDGEGCVTIRRGTAISGQVQYSSFVGVGMTSVKPLRFLQECFGGTLDAQKPLPNRKLVWRWKLPASETVRFLITTLPYLKVKEEQALVVLAFLGTFRQKGELIPEEVQTFRRELFEECAHLKKVSG